MSRTFILDVSSFVHRAYHVSKDRPTFTKDGTPNAAVNVFRTMLNKLRNDHSPDYLVAACDVNEPSFRMKLYPAYKAQRPAPDEALVKQLPGCRAVLIQEHIPIFEMAGYEADDIIGTLCQRIEGDVVIVSGDKDMAQLVEWSGRVTMLNTNTNKFLDDGGVFEEYGIYPSHVVDYLALVGDTSDNVPGCNGVGPEGARMLLKMFNGVEDIIRNAGQISSNRYRHAVLAHREDILLSKRLVTIDCNVPLPEDLVF
jgi:DNA polymerase-1